MRGFRPVRRSVPLASAVLVPAIFALAATGCGLMPLRSRSRADFFPLAPQSRWEYVVNRRAGRDRFHFVATVRPNDFQTADGRSCRVVDEQYGDVGETERFPVVYCIEDGFLHRVMSLEYKGETLEDNGLRSGELKFLPMDLPRAGAWEGITNAYRLPDGSGFEVEQLHRVVPTPERVVVPAGDFAGCVRVETTAIHSAVSDSGVHTGPRVVYYYSDWYAPGVGLVKTQQRGTDDAVLATIELIRYDIGSTPR
jgi:hypothetical protein